jgi:hypothetical protein
MNFNGNRITRIDKIIAMALAIAVFIIIYKLDWI